MARPWLIRLSRLPRVTSPTSLFLPEDASTGNWSKPFSRIVSIASEQRVTVVTVVIGFRRRVLIVASLKGDLVFEMDIEVRRFWVGRVGDGGFVVGGVGGRRSFAASQSSSTNCCRC